MTRLFRAILLSILILPLAGCVINLPLDPYAGRERIALERIEEPDKMWTSDKVLLVAIDGMIDAQPESERSFGPPSALVQVKDALDRARKDDDIRAVVLRIDSPGGPVTASDLIYREVLRFKNERKVPVVAIGMDVMASGGYYVACAADRILLHPTSVTGSIGVIGLFPNLQPLGRKIGVEMRVIKSGELKDIGSIWRAFSDEEQEILQQTIQSMYERFLDVVEGGRTGLDRERIRTLADGRIYTARQALDAGLADRIGYIEDAVEVARELAGITDSALVRYSYPGNYLGHYYAQAPAAPATAQFNLLHLEIDRGELAARAPFHYLWLP